MKLEEDGVMGAVPTNNVGGGAVAGIGVPNPNLPNQGEPGKKKKKIIPLMSFIRRKLPVSK